jgi:hypothetical protein
MIGIYRTVAATAS